MSVHLVFIALGQNQNVNHIHCVSALCGTSLYTTYKKSINNKQQANTVVVSLDIGAWMYDTQQWCPNAVQQCVLIRATNETILLVVESELLIIIQLCLIIEIK